MTRLACLAAVVATLAACGGGGGGGGEGGGDQMRLEVKFTGAGGTALPAGEPRSVTINELGTLNQWTPDVAADGTLSTTVPVAAGRAINVYVESSDPSLADRYNLWFDSDASVDLGAIDLGTDGLARDAANTHTTAYPLSFCWTAYTGPTPIDQLGVLACTSTGGCYGHQLSSTTATCFSYSKQLAIDDGLGGATGIFGVYINRTRADGVHIGKEVLFNTPTFVYPPTTP